MYSCFSIPVLTNSTLLGLNRLPVLFDIGLLYFPGPDIDTSDTIRQVFYYLCIVPFIFVALQPFYVVFYPKTSPSSRFCIVQLLRRYACIYCIAVSLRIVSFMMTVLPSSGLWCHNPSVGGTYDVNDPSGPQNVKEILFSIDLEYGCGDMIFSGHTIFVLTCCMTSYRYQTPHFTFSSSFRFLPFLFVHPDRFDRILFT